MARQLTLLVMCLVVGAATAATTPCSFYDTCTDCVCQRQDYDLSDSCPESPDCQWCESSGTCQSTGDTCSEPVTSLLPSGRSTKYPASSDLKYVMCPLETAAGTVATTSIYLTLALLFVVYATVSYCRNKAAANSMPDATFLTTALQQHTPETDSVLWQGSAIPAWRQGSGFWSWVTFTTILLSVPSIVWLAIGLPVSIQEYFSFGFFFPICFVGSIGVLSVLGGCVGSAFTRPPTVNCYCLTDKHAFVATGNLKTKKMVRLVAHGLKQISGVTVTGNTVRFKTGSGFIGSSVSFQNLSDTGRVFQILQGMQSHGTAAGTSGSTAVGIPIAQVAAQPIKGGGGGLMFRAAP